MLISSEGFVSARIRGPGAGRAFQAESGKHCVQRVSDTEARGRSHTSIVTVSILPIPTRVAPMNLTEVEITCKRGSGPGGQHKNKTESCVVAVHRPTGLSATVDSRDQQQNRRQALEILACRVEEQRQQITDHQYSQMRRVQRDGGGRSNKIRTYNFIKGRAVDHRTGARTSQVVQVLKGRFDLLQGG